MDMRTARAQRRRNARDALGVPHSKYWHKVYSKIQDDKLVVVSQAAGGNFIETLTLGDGKQVTRNTP
jgi:hypothetical protein